MSNERKDVTITVRMDRSLKTKMDERPETTGAGSPGRRFEELSRT